MELIWDCMNIASRVTKQVEASDTLVPKYQQQSSGITPSVDLQELLATVSSVRTTLVPFVTSSKKSKGASENPGFEICLKGIKQTLNDMFNFFKDLEKEFSIYTWKTQKVKLYQIDFLLKQKLDNFSSLFNVEESKDKKKGLTNGAALIMDNDGKDMWMKCFGESTVMVPWSVFFSSLETYLGLNLKEDEDILKMFLDFTKKDHVSSFEFSVFLKWFGPLKYAIPRMLEAVKGGLLCGFVPAVEASLLLEGKKDGTFLIRCSKTQPGSFAVTFVDSALKVKHCLLYSVHPSGVTLKTPPTVYQSLKEFSDAHTNKLKIPLGNKYTLLKNLPGFAYGKATQPSTAPAPMEQQPQPTGSTTTTTTTVQMPNNNNNGMPAAPGGHDQSKAMAANDTCVVCMDAPFETVFLECGHLACCATCSSQLKICPICRNPISRIIPIFRAT